MREEVKIRKLDAVLYVDDYCYGCKKRYAESYLYHHDGRKYCEKCYFRKVDLSAMKDDFRNR